ncbi:MAG: hypothetical protein ACE5HT_15680 [Gemmatimonadales bacterium]
MPPQIIEAVAALIAMFGIGTFVLIAMKMRINAKAMQQKDPEALERVTDALERLMDQTHALREDMAELQERLDFHERLLAQPKGEGHGR